MNIQVQRQSIYSVMMPQLGDIPETKERRDLSCKERIRRQIQTGQVRDRREEEKQDHGEGEKANSKRDKDSPSHTHTNTHIHTQSERE